MVNAVASRSVLRNKLVLKINDNNKIDTLEMIDSDITYDV